MAKLRIFEFCTAFLREKLKNERIKRETLRSQGGYSIPGGWFPRKNLGFFAAHFGFFVPNLEFPVPLSLCLCLFLPRFRSLSRARIRRRGGGSGNGADRRDRMGLAYACEDGGSLRFSGGSCAFDGWIGKDAGRRGNAL